MYVEQAKNIKWLQLPEHERDAKISRAMEKGPMRELVKQGVHSLITYIYKSRESKMEFSVNLFGKHEIRLGESPEHIEKAEEILKILQMVGYVLDSDVYLPRMSPMSRTISLFAPEAKSKGYKNVHNFLMQASVPHSSEYRRAIALKAIESSLNDALGKILPNVLIEYIMEIVKLIPEDAFHGRNVDDYRSQFSIT